MILIYWSYKEKDKPGVKHMSLFILLSFGFYVPVVLWADKYPVIGALMMIIYLASRSYDLEKVSSLRKPIYVFMTGFTFTIVNMMLIGIYEVASEGKDIVNRAAMDGISGIGHIVLAIGIVRIIVKLFQNESMSGLVSVKEK